MNTIAEYLHYFRNIQVTESEAAELDKHWNSLDHEKAKAVSAANQEETAAVTFDATRAYDHG